MAAIPSAFVQGESGTIFDASGRLYLLPYLNFNRTGAQPPLPTQIPAEAAAACERHARLASLVSRYGHMYYHFVEEVLPRVVLLQESGLLTPDTQLLTWGEPYEHEASRGHLCLPLGRLGQVRRALA